MKQEVKAQLQASQEKLQNSHKKGEKKNSKKMLKSRDRLIDFEIQLNEIKNDIRIAEENGIKISAELETSRLSYMSIREQVESKYWKVLELKSKRNKIVVAMNNGNIQGFFPRE